MGQVYHNVNYAPISSIFTNYRVFQLIQSPNDSLQRKNTKIQTIHRYIFVTLFLSGNQYQGYFCTIMRQLEAYDSCKDINTSQ